MTFLLFFQVGENEMNKLFPSVDSHGYVYLQVYAYNNTLMVGRKKDTVNFTANTYLNHILYICYLFHSINHTFF